MADIVLNGDTSGAITVSAPAVAGTNTLTLPATTGTVLDDNSSLDATKLTGALPAISGASLTGLTASQLPAGSVLQVISGEKGSTFVGTSVVDNGGYFIDVTGYSATITPASTSNKILVTVHAYIGQTSVASGYQQSLRIRQGTNYPFAGTSEGGRPTTSARVSNYVGNTHWMGMISGSWLHSPSSTSALTYQVQLGGYSGTPIVYLNRSEAFQAAAGNYDTMPLSTITLMEIAG